MALTTVKSDQIQTSVALAGSPTTTTQSASDNSTKIATTAYADTAVANLVASAPSALNTLDELAAALNDDASFSTTVTNSIATKLPLAGGTMTGTLAMDAAIDIKSGSAIHGTITTSSSSLTLNARNTGHLIFQSGGSEKMRLANGGNVGIGDDNPSEKFVVKGDGARMIVSSADMEVAMLGRAGSSGAALDKGYLRLRNQGVTADGVVISAAGDSWLNAGNVGIGTASPTEKLHVEGSLLVNVATASGLGEEGIFFRSGFSNTNKYNLSILSFAHDGSGGFSDGISINGYDGVSFCTGSNSRQERMRVATNGNVGIGTLTPAKPLHISSADNQLLRVESTDAYAGIEIKDSGSATLPPLISALSNDFIFYGGHASARPELMRLTTGGQVGINAVSPAGTLHTVARSGTTGLVVTGVASNNIATFARSTGQTLGIKELGSTSLELESSTSLGYDVGSGYNHEFMVAGAQVFKIYSDGKVDIKNSSTDKIARFINTGSGTQGITIGTTTGNSAGTGVHIGHEGSKAYIHPYNYGGGAYQQMEIACSDFVLKTNGSSTGMTMDTARVATFYGDIKINDANDRLLQNGVGREAKAGYINGNQTVSYTINLTNQSTVHIRCGFNHYGLMSYGCALDQIYANGSGGLTSLTALINHTTSLGGSWSVARVDNTNITITKNAGNYAGGGYYYIIVEGANL